MKEESTPLPVPPTEEVPEVEVIDEEFSLLAKIDPNHSEDEFLRVNDEFVEQGFHEDEVVEDDDPDAEERHKEHIKRKKSDKIFNNTYNTGDGGTEESSFNSDIRISSSHSDSYLHDPEKYKDHLDRKIFQEDIEKIIDNSFVIQEIVTSEPNKKKYTKVEINAIFKDLKEKLTRGTEKSRFISSIYILDAISGLTTLEYRKLFDMLEYEYKEDLLEELNQKFKILDHIKSNKLF